MATEATTGPSLSLLPPEIILHIIRLASPRDSVKRRSDLCSFALVDSTWKVFAQQELLKHIRVPAQPRNGLLKAVKAGGADRVKSIVSLERYPPKMTEELLRRCKKSCLELDLDVNNPEHDEEPALALQIHNMKELRMLHLREDNNLPSPPQMSAFVHLRRLSLALVRPAQDCAVHWQYIHPTNLPALTSLNLIFLGYGDDLERLIPGLRHALHLIAPQLKSLLLATDDVNSVVPLEHLGTAAVQLESLYLETRPEDVKLIGTSLTHTLRTLELGGYMVNNLATHLRSWIGSSVSGPGPTLQRLVLHQCSVDEFDPTISSWCTAEEVQLMCGESNGEWNADYLIDWNPL